MKTTRFIQPDEKISLVYTIGSYIAACGPVSIAGIRAEVNRQYIGAENVSEKRLMDAIKELLAYDAADYYESDTVFQSTNKTVEYIEMPRIKYEKR